MKSQPDLKLLATFLAVVREGSMVEAAAALSYVPSAVSQHVAALERDLGVELILRRPGSRLVLTAHGRELVRAAESLFDATARFKDLAHSLGEGRVTELRLGSHPSAMTYLLPQVLTAVAEQHPGTAVRLIEVETAEGLPLLRGGDLDLLVGYRYLPEDPPASSSAWSITALGTEPLVLVAPLEPDRSGPLELAECLDRDWISGHPHNPDRRLLHRWAGELGITPRVTRETEDLHSMLAMVRAGHAVGLVPATLLGTEGARRGLQVVSLPATALPPRAPALRREILALRRPTNRLAVIDTLVAELAGTLTQVVGS